MEVDGEGVDKDCWRAINDKKPEISEAKDSMALRRHGAAPSPDPRRARVHVSI